MRVLVQNIKKKSCPTQCMMGKANLWPYVCLKIANEVFSSVVFMVLLVVSCYQLTIEDIEK